MIAQKSTVKSPVRIDPNAWPWMSTLVSTNYSTSWSRNHLFRNSLIDRSASEVLELHQYAKDVVGKKIHVDGSIEMLRALKKTAIENAKLDIGRLTYEWTNTMLQQKFIINQLSDFFSTSNHSPRDVVLFGFGRIGS